MEPSFLPSKLKRDPKMIGLWKVGRTLGKGNSGHVRIARHSKTGQYAAIKIISKSNLPSRVSLNRVADEVEHGLLAIEREIVVMKLLDHPNIMKLYDVWETSTNLYLILEYIQGGELFDYLCANGPRPIPEVLSYFQQIICAVDYCHRFNVAHRDLKLENVLIDKDSSIKVADFGMATWQDRAGQKLLQTSCGSPHYAAPEVVSGKPYNGPPADIWSCGVILYALIVARLPFDDDDCATVLRKISIGKYDIPDDVDPRARDLISRMLTLDVANRITMPEIFRHPFFISQPLKNPQHYPALDIDNASEPITHLSSIDPDIFCNLRILWHGTPDSQIIDALMSPERNWQKGIYHLLMNYRKKDLAARREEEEYHRSHKKIKQPSSNEQAELAVPCRVAPPTPRRARGPSFGVDYDSTSNLGPPPGISILGPRSNNNQSLSPALGSLAVPELEDPKIQQFFQQVANHLNVLQARTNSSGSNSPRETSPTPNVYSPGHLTLPFSQRQLPYSDKENNTHISSSAGDAHTGVKPLGVRRKVLPPLPTVTIGEDKENRAPITEADILMGRSPLTQHQYPVYTEKRLCGLPTSLERRISKSKPRKEPSRLSSSPAPSDASSSFLLPSPAESFSSAPKRSWIDNVFKFNPATYTLYSKFDVHTTRNECRRLLMQLDMLVSLEESEKLGVLKCRYSDSKDSHGVSNGAKSLKFRVELQWPTPQLCQDGYLVTLNLIQEKGSLESFKGVYQHLVRIWTVGNAAANLVTHNLPPMGRGLGHVPEVYT